MSGASSRRKGATYERRVAKYLTERGIAAVRNVEQTRSGGDDLDLPEGFAEWLSIECKDRASSSLGAWVDQSVRQAGSRVAVVIHHRRGNGRAENDFATMTVADFVKLVELAYLATRAVELEPADVEVER